MTTVRMQFVSRPVRKDAQLGRVVWFPLVKVMGAFVLVASILFVHVWLPIQSERSSIKLKRLESQVSLKKAELNDLNNTYSKMTSLTALDHWAKKHGPWVNAQTHNVLQLKKQ